MSRIEQRAKMSFPRSGLRPGRFASPAFWAVATTVAFAAAACQAQGVLPAHGVVTSGAASIQQSGSNLSVTQTSPRAIVNWGSFSIGQGNGVTFDQPNASSAILNRVTGSTTSTIAGQLQANGQVYLVNPNGIAITPTGTVRVGGGFVASTLGISDSDFNSGDLRFSGSGASAAVSNEGSIQAGSGGFVGLIGGTVSNSGVVSVPLGKVAMGSGEQATLNLTGDNFLQVAVPTDAKTADGKALIDVSGKVVAAGGRVELRAATVAKAIRDAVNVPGELSVASARAIGGAILLSGGPGGNVTVAGRIDASGRTKGGAIAINAHDVALRRAKIAAGSATGVGGSVTVTGTNAVSLASTSVDASGATGGGAIRIGGDFHGGSDLASARTTSINSASTLNASAIVSGDGGTVAVWSDGTTSFAGQIAATGGAGGGNGGYVEVSASPVTHGVLDFTGGADLTAPNGATGTLLLDPYDIVISSGANSGGSFSGGVYTPTSTSVINASTLENQLALANVVVSTGLLGSPGSNIGDLTVLAPIVWSSNNGLSLIAENGIFVSAPITSAGGGQLALNAGSLLSIQSTLSTSTGGITLTGPTTDLDADVTTSGGAITFNNPVQLQSNVTLTAGSGSIAFGSTVDSAIRSCLPTGACGLTASAAALSFGGALGGTRALGAVSLTSASSMALPSIAATTLLAEATGAASDLTLAPGATLAASGFGTPVTLGAGRGFINQSGPGAIGLTPGARWLIYSANPANDAFGGLNSGNTAVWNTPLGGAVAATGNRYVFAFQPKITVTAANLIKPFGLDVTALVAADYTISGVQPGIAGAFLPDTAAAVYSGAPVVFSAGSPASAPSTAVPYPIIVGPGSLVIGDGYGFAANPGLLTVLPLPSDPGFLPGLTQINNPAGGGYDVGAFGELLQDFSSCEEPPSLPDPNRYADPDEALRAISHALDNYFKRCQNPTQATIADALDAYAARLRVLAPRLPPALRNVPAIIAEAARRIRAARSRSEAVAVLHQTVAAIHKEIALVLSEDPQTRAREVRDGDMIAGALGGASVALVNSGGL